MDQNTLKAKDIAKIMGVSTAAVSMAINDRPGVSRAKKEEIINKIHELHADHLLKNQTVPAGSISFVIFKRYGQIVNESPFFNYLLEGITYKLRSKGYTMTFGIIDRSMSVGEQLEHIQALGCRGMLIFGTEMKHGDMRAFKESGLPFVVMDNSFQEYDFDTVCINNLQGVSQAVKYLIENGHRRIGYIRCRERINSFEERYAAFQQHLHTRGLTLDPQDIIDLEYDESRAKEETMAYLRERENQSLPTAFFAENDFLGCSAMRGFKEMGYRVPEEVSFIGYDNRPITQLMSPVLSTINVPKDIFGPVAADLLLERIEGRSQSIKIEVGTNLVEGGTVYNLLQS